jgi:hypothetical protein
VVTQFTELMAAADALGIRFGLTEGGGLGVTRPETAEAADVAWKLKPHKDAIIAALVAAALIPESLPVRCLVRGCEARDVREYQSPTRLEVYCPRHAAMCLWSEHVKAGGR